jgi:hypothetical protein
MLLENIALSLAMTLVTLALHFLALAELMKRLGSDFAEKVRQGQMVMRTGGVMLFVLAIGALHAIEIGLYAWLYLALDAIEGIEPAIYFSTAAFGTLGAQDADLHDNWRLLGATEGVTGFVLIGVSTAFLVAAIDRMGLMGGVRKGPPAG